MIPKDCFVTYDIIWVSSVQPRTVLGCLITKAINPQPPLLWGCWHYCYLLPALEVKRAAVSRMIKSAPANPNGKILHYRKAEFS